MEKAKIILALDSLVDKGTLREACSYVHGIKIGLPLTLDIGVSGVKDLVKGIDVDEVIVDFKLADIGDIMVKIASKLDFADSFISHSFVGRNGALDELKGFLDSKGKKLYLVGAMSHPGWDDSLNSYTVSVIREVNPYGIVTPATRGDVISKFRHEFADKVIISPGLGTQGAKYGEAICHGASFEIIGRSIFSSSPLKALNKIVEKQREEVLRCKGAENRE
ncbi:orotidine 5'-phosphate decarboxylase / HUMPS family protein [Sulfuracidifex tepidarius]|uniref:Orotidine 5'-phosphate decarboxylase n=1 Tax=Sulfuracidifex tepidarius TaxID=1294262 RepID=A0A510E2P6_9CREN|nr:orotidine 5'-phosphate decarboxylase / HUMPS family protein [Sulfuracidifex tepidarius]BBG24036.1 Orotidine 5'-phosphate decarboxylase [Sulfuracidifex tepidarius]BBG26791.1 Orotidine 5'-phosphate decarboxylase [Sulfuracidifex tepidarius]